MERAEVIELALRFVATGRFTELSTPLSTALSTALPASP
jgi:hypothetical protein